MTHEQRDALNAAYGALLEEYTGPTLHGVFNFNRQIALGYLKTSKPEMAAYHVIHAGVPRELVLTVQTLIYG